MPVRILLEPYPVCPASPACQATSPPVRVVSASFGRSGSPSQLEISAINGTLRSAGILLMAAAGNSEPQGGVVQGWMGSRSLLLADLSGTWYLERCQGRNCLAFSLPAFNQHAPLLPACLLGTSARHRQQASLLATAPAWCRRAEQRRQRQLASQLRRHPAQRGRRWALLLCGLPAAVLSRIKPAMRLVMVFLTTC